MLKKDGSNGQGQAVPEQLDIRMTCKCGIDFTAHVKLQSSPVFQVPMFHCAACPGYPRLQAHTPVPVEASRLVVPQMVPPQPKKVIL